MMWLNFRDVCTGPKVLRCYRKLLASGRQTLQFFRHHQILIALPETFIRDDARIGENLLTYKTALKLKPLIETLETIRTRNSTGA